MRVVLDANVLVSALISAKGIPARLLVYWQEDKFDLVLSAATLQELERVLYYPRLREQYPLPEEEIQQFLHLLRTLAIEVTPSEEIAAVERDPTDNRYIECALDGVAQYIVSGDGHLLDLREYRGIRILTPIEFVTVLQLQREPPKPDSLPRQEACLMPTRWLAHRCSLLLRGHLTPASLNAYWVP